MSTDGTPLSRARHPDEETRYRAVLRLDPSLAAERTELLARLSDPSWRVRSAAVERFAGLTDPGAVLPALIELLDGAESVAGRAAAEAALASLGDAALPSLLDQLASSTGVRRLSALAAIGAIGSSRAVPALAACLADPDRAVRIAGAETLGRIGGPEAVESLLAALDSDDPMLRATALDALGALRAPPPLERLAALMTDPGLRPGAYRALAASDEPEALFLLVGGLTEPGRTARLAALASMGAQRARHAAGALAPLAAETRRIAADDPSVAERCVEVLESAEPLVAEGALLVLGWIGEITHAPAVARMAGEERLRPLVEEALEGLPSGAGLVEVLGQVLPGLSPVARVVTYAALARAGDPTAYQALLDRAADQDPLVQAQAVTALGRLGWGASVPVLGGLLDDDAPAVAGLAAEALTGIGQASEAGQRAVLLECRARAAAGGSAALFRVLGACGEGEDLRLVRLGLRAEGVERRAAAAAAVAELGQRGLLRGEHLPELIAALSDAAWPVRVAAARAFADLGRGQRRGQGRRPGGRRASALRRRHGRAPERAAGRRGAGACRGGRGPRRLRAARAPGGHRRAGQRRLRSRRWWWWRPCARWPGSARRIPRCSAGRWSTPIPRWPRRWWPPRSGSGGRRVGSC